MASGSSPDPIAGSPSSRTSARTIVVVSAHVQFVVQTVFTTSSHTVGDRSIRPAPAVAHDRSGSSGRERVEAREVLVQPEHVRRTRGDRCALRGGDRATAERLDASEPAASRADPDPTRPPARHPHREVQGAAVGVDRERRQIRETVRDQRAPQVDGLAAGAAEPELDRGRRLERRLGHRGQGSGRADPVAAREPGACVARLACGGARAHGPRPGGAPRIAVGRPAVRSRRARSALPGRRPAPHGARRRGGARRRRWSRSRG